MLPVTIAKKILGALSWVLQAGDAVRYVDILN